MSFTIQPLIPSDAGEALAILKDLSNRGEVLYRPLEMDDFLSRFFGENRWGFAARDDSGVLCGWAHASAKTAFLPGETAENTPLYMTLLLVRPDHHGSGVGSALLEAVKVLGRTVGKRSVVVSGSNPVHMAWLIPGANGHDHNNAPGADENCAGCGFLLNRGFSADCHEISLYMDLNDYVWDSSLDSLTAALAADGVRVGRWEPGLGENFDGMCDRVGSEYWRNVLRRELEAWRTGLPNDDPELWPDGIRPNGPRPILTATVGDSIVGFTGPVGLQKSGRGWFTGICTDPEYGGRGVATVLFNLLMREFIDESARFCSLFTGRENHAQKIYLRAGMRIVASFAVLSCPL